MSKQELKDKIQKLEDDVLEYEQLIKDLDWEEGSGKDIEDLNLMIIWCNHEIASCKLKLSAGV